MAALLRAPPKRLAVFLLHLTVSLLNTELAKSPSFWPDEWIPGMGGGDLVLETDGVGRLCVGETNGAG